MQATLTAVSTPAGSSAKAASGWWSNSERKRSASARASCSSRSTASGLPAEAGGANGALRGPPSARRPANEADIGGDGRAAAAAARSTTRTQTERVALE